MTASNTDRIEKTIVLRAPQSRVFKALTDSGEFGTWFRARLEGPFQPGTRTLGQITHPGYEHVKMELDIEHIEPESYFSFRWHPYAVEPGVDYSQEPSTLVEFRLSPAEGGGTLLEVSESGFDALPASRRDEAFRMNSRGWEGQLRNIEKHVDS